MTIKSTPGHSAAAMTHRSQVVLLHRYNYSCVRAAALACGAIPLGQQSAAQAEICSLLSGVLAAGCTSRQQITGDPDFDSVRNTEWYATLVREPDEVAMADKAAVDCEE